MRRLIINADDFGLTPGINRAIAEAHIHGVVTSATLMANAPAFMDATQLARAAPQLGVGCHVVLVDGPSLLPRSHITTLAGEHESQFRDSLPSFALRAISGRLNLEEIAAEATAQIRKLQSAGIAVTHLDTHKHTHMFPAVLRALLRAAHSSGVRALRNPFTPSRAVPLRILSRRSAIWKRYFEVVALRSLAGGFRTTVQQAGLVTTDGCFGVVETGSLDLELFEAVVSSIPDGTWEFVCHPGYNDTDLAQAKTHLRVSRAREMEVLTSDRVRQAVDRRGIELITYRDLVADEVRV